MMKPCHIPQEQLFRAFERIYNGTHLSEGYYTKAFEDEASDLYDQEAISVNSAGSALFTVLRHMAGKGKKVIVSNNTFFATGAMAIEAGFEVVIADCGEDFCLTADTVREVLDDDVVGVILTHVGGPLATEYEKIADMCERRGVWLVEDAAHAYGVFDNGLYPGRRSIAAVFSFYPTKAVPVGEGGLIVTKNKELADLMRRFRNYGKTVEDGKVVYNGAGFNFRMDEWTAAVAYLQTKRLAEILANRAELAHKINQVVPMHPAFLGRESNFYKYIVPADTSLSKEAGGVYARSDCLDMALQGMHGVHKAPSLSTSHAVADGHKCVPFAEGMYKGLHGDSLKKEIMK